MFHMKKYILFCLVILISFCEGYEYRLSVAAITQGDHEYLEEWIRYHHAVGVDHFYIYDNNKGSETRDALQSFIDQGLVELIHWPNLWPKKRFVDTCQVRAYQDALKRAKLQTEWLAIIDTDEFIVPKKASNILSVLDEHYREHSTVYINWRQFGTSNEYITPGDPILRKLVKCSKESSIFNTYGKTICRPEYMSSVTNVHFVNSIFPCMNGSGNVRTDGEYAADLFVINHYALRDENFLRNVKVPRNIKMWKFNKTEEEALEEFQVLNQELSEEEDYRLIEIMNEIGMD